MGLLDHMLAQFLIYWGTSILFFIVAAPVILPLTMYRVLFSPHPCQHLFPLVFLIMDILTNIIWWSLIEVLINISLRFSAVGIFSCTCWPFVYILWKNVCSGAQTPFLHWSLVFDIDRYIYRLLGWYWQEIKYYEGCCTHFLIKKVNSTEINYSPRAMRRI